MGYIDLSNQAMAVISGAWLDPNKERPLLAALPRVAPLLVDLGVVHDGLVSYDQTPKHSERLAELYQKVAELDARHDRLARGLHDYLSGAIELVENPAEADALRDLQRELFPQGKSITKRSYIDQAGEAPYVEQRLSDRSRRVLQTLFVGGRPLEHHAQRWLAAAKELGAVETERRVLAKEKPDTPTLRQLRNEWVGIVKTIVSLLDRETGLSEADRRRILEPLESELAKAEAKKRASTVVEAKGAEEKAEVG